MINVPAIANVQAMPHTVQCIHIEVQYKGSLPEMGGDQGSIPRRGDHGQVCRVSNYMSRDQKLICPYLGGYSTYRLHIEINEQVIGIL